MSEKMDLKEFVEAEQARRAAEREAYLEEKDYKDFVKWDQGVTEFTLHAVIPREHLSYGAQKKVFRIEIKGKDFDWSVNPLSPMYGELLVLLLEAPVACRINRLGEGLETRYSLLPGEAAK